MKRILLLLSVIVSIGFGGVPPTDVAKYVKDISVQVREKELGYGTGVVYSRTDDKNQLVNYVWTAAHVVAEMRKETLIVENKVIKEHTVTFDNVIVYKQLVENAVNVGDINIDAKVVKYSKITDFALLKLSKVVFNNSVVFNLDKEVVPLGLDLFHVGHVCGKDSDSAVTTGLYSQYNFQFEDHVFDVATVLACAGCSGGGIFNKHDGRYLGMLVRGRSDLPSCVLIVPVRQLFGVLSKHNLMWAVDPTVKYPTEKELDLTKIDLDVE